MMNMAPGSARKQICVSIACPDTAKAVRAAQAAEPLADVIEIRLDSLADPAITPFMEAIKKPLLFTNRPQWEGGAFTGQESDRIALLLEACRAGCAYVDIELLAEDAGRREVIAVAKANRTRTIVSWHDFSGTPSSQALAQMFQRQYRSGAHIGKIVTTAKGFQDVLRVLNLQPEAVEMDFPLIAFCMGRAGMISRVATLELGGFMTYAAPDNGAATATGQLPVTAVRAIMGHFGGNE